MSGGSETIAKRKLRIFGLERSKFQRNERRLLCQGDASMKLLLTGLLLKANVSKAP